MEVGIGAAPAATRPTGRLVLEWTLRAVAMAMLVLALLRLLRPVEAPPVQHASGTGVPAALARWTASPEVRGAHVTVSGVPSDTLRDWMRALRGAGTALGYTQRGAEPVAVSAEPLADPAGGVRVWAAASTPVALADAVGLLDTLRPSGAGAALAARRVASPVMAAVPGVSARARIADSLVLRPVLVLGSAGWEGKFAIAALEERGWTVVARLSVAPGVAVDQGSVGAIDTARYAAVVALDTAARPFAARIAAYVRSGGGLVLAPAAATLPALGALAPARPSAPDRGDAGLLASADARRGLPLGALRELRADAVATERRGVAVAVAARREQLGRVVLHGYDETWRWRMQGGAGAPFAHREWWAGLVAAAAYAPAEARGAVARDASLNDAPVARFVDVLGASSPEPRDAAAPRRMPVPWWLLFAVAAVALLGEWASRRLRGAR